MRKDNSRKLAGTLLLLVLLAAYAASATFQDRGYAQRDAGGAGRELLQNPGFERREAKGLPEGWTRDMAQTGNKGTVRLDRSGSHSGSASLTLQPNNRNGGFHPLAIFQVIPAGEFRGQRVTFSGFLRAEGGAIATLGMLNFVRGKPSNLVTVEHTGGAGWTQRSMVYDVPDDASVQLILSCHVQGTSGSAWFDDVSVTPYVAARGDRPPVPTVAPGALKASAEIDASKVLRVIPRTLYGTNVEWIWGGNLLWDEKAGRLAPELVRLTGDLGVTLIRFPGGQYSDFYPWKSGIGPMQSRREVLHAKGKQDRSRPTLGTDEALDFAARVNSELLITVNAGSGTAREAAEWVSYVNRKSRRVNYWEVGNELYMNEGSATSKAVTVNPSLYATRFREFAQAMRGADAGIKVGAIGGENQGLYAGVTYPKWNQTVLEKAGDQMDFLAVHNAYAPAVFFGDKQDVRTVYKGMLAAPVLIARNLETVSRQIGQYAPAHASRIKIAITEWGPYFSLDPKSRYVDHNKTLGSALFVASALKAFIESPQTDIANFFLLNDVSVVGWIGSRNGEIPPNPDWAPSARYYAFQLYTRHFGERLVSSRASGPTFDSETVGLIDAVRGAPYLDIVSSLSADGRTLYVMAINKHFDSSIEGTISIKGFEPRDGGVAWTLNGTGIDAHTGTTPLKIPGLSWARQAEDDQNPRFSRGGANEVTLTSSAVKGMGRQFTYQFPAHSVTSLVLTRSR